LVITFARGRGTNSSLETKEKKRGKVSQKRSQKEIGHPSVSPNWKGRGQGPFTSADGGGGSVKRGKQGWRKKWCSLIKARYKGLSSSISFKGVKGRGGGGGGKQKRKSITLSQGERP